ncbi:MAG: diguanylate cyclase [Lachnospirales bacterium]
MGSYILIVLFTLCGFTNFFLLYRAIFKNAVIKNEYYVYFNVAVWLYTIGCITELYSNNKSFAFVSICIQYLGFPFIPVFYMLYIKKFIGEPIKSIKSIVVLMLLASLCFVLVLTNNKTGLVFKSFDIVKYDNINSADISGTIIYYAMYIFFYILYLYAFVSLIQCYIKSDKQSKLRIITLLIVSFMSLVSEVLYIIGFTPYGVDITPIFATIINLALGYDLYVKNAFTHTSYSRGFALEEMQDAYILIDNNGSYIDSNKKAISIFPQLKNSKKNRNIFTIIQNNDINKLKDKSLSFLEFSIENEENVIIDYTLNITSVMDKNGVEIFAWLINDTTEYRRLMLDLEYMAKYDTGSGIFNRRTFYDEVMNNFEINKESSNLAMLMIDIDYFKRVNDKYGHLCGDYVIKEVASRLSNLTRKEDVIGRYGGEEFVIYLNDISREALVPICKKINRIIEEKEFVFNNKSFNVTVSIGCSFFDKQIHTDLNDLLKSADDNLYKAKQSGRNQAIIN